MSRPMSHSIVVCLSLASCVREPSPTGEHAGTTTPTDSTLDSRPPDTGPADTGPKDTGTHDTGDSPVDSDGDGYTTTHDCDDTDPLIHPAAEDDCDDAVDEDCVDGPRDCDPLPYIMLDDADTTILPGHSGGESDSIGYVAVALGDLDADGTGDFGTLWMADGYWSGDRAHKEAWVFSGPVDTGNLMADDEAVAIIHQTDEWDDRLSAMASAGDVDADGYDDIVLGTWDNAGTVSVLLGPIDGTLTVDHYAAASWTGDGLIRGAGWSVDGGFDFDGDGHDDFVVGAPWAFDDAGAAFWISGDDLEFEHFSDADAILAGLSTDSCRGWAVTGLGDVDGDGLEDFATGAYTGSVFVYTGGALSGELDSLDAAHAGFDRESDDDQHGKGLADGGDFNDDGYADLSIAATDSLAGTVHLMAGPMDESGDAAALALATFDGESPGDDLGDGMDGRMDVNTDGNTDLLLGAPSVRLKGSSHLNGAAYLFYGPMTGSVDMSMARCAMRGTMRNAESGWSVAMIGDQYGDGAPEMLIGEPLTTASAMSSVWTGGVLSVVSSEHL
jgi:hypothetical protein